jgi:hypothetical protein
MAVPKGGRGIRASYETTHVRIPLPIKEIVEKISNHYKETEEIPSIALLDHEQALDIARRILKYKKSARISLEKLLKSIYKQDIKF